MSMTDLTVPFAVVPPPTVARRWTRGPGPLVAALVVAVTAFGVRAIGLHRGFELWVDEMLYAELGRSVSRGEMPNLPDGPFFLHPPGFFVLEGLVIKLFGLGGDSLALVYELRWLSAVVGAIGIALAFLLADRLVGRRIAVGVAVVAAFEPFILRNNSRVFLETTAGTLLLAGLLVLVVHLERARPPRRTAGLLVGAGLAFGLAIVTKDVFAVYALGAVALCVVWRHTLPLRQAVVVVVAAAVPYAAYLLTLVATGYFGNWWTAKSDGVIRAVGAKQVTGFNAPNAPSLVDRLIVQVGQFGTSYVLLLACPVAGIIAALSARRGRRLIGLLAAVTGALGLYLALFGTFEEQYGYGIMLAGVLASAVAVAEIIERRPRATRVVAVVATVFTLATVALGLRAELTQDDGYREFKAWTATAALPADAKVSVTNSTAQLAFADDPRFGVWPSPQAMLANGAGYILTQSLPARQGYDYEPPETLDWLERTATPVFRQAGPTNGDLVLWRVDPAALRSRASGGP